MRISILGCLIAGLMLAQQVSAQEPAGPAGRFPVSGVVLDSITGRPVPAATVSFRSSRRVVFTDSAGRFALDAAGAADNVQVRQMGYATVKLKVAVGARMAPLVIRLVPDPLWLEAITARARFDGLHTIEGTVVDSVTGRPVPRVVVWFRSSGGNAVTDTLGHYVFEGAKGGREDVVVDVLGYFRRTAYRDITQPWQRLDLALQPDPIVLQAIVVLTERLKHVSVLGSGFRHYFSERDLASSGRPTVADYFQWAQVYARPHKPGSPYGTDRGYPADLPCTMSGVRNTLARPRFMMGDTLVLPTGMLPAGGSDTEVYVDGREVLGGSTGQSQVEPSDFYRAVFTRDTRCGGINYAVILTKSGLRRGLHYGGRQSILSRDSLEALLTRVDTLR